MNAARRAEAALSRILKENPYPAGMHTANDDKKDCGLHHRASSNNGHCAQSPPATSAPAAASAAGGDGQRIPFYILPCLSFGTGDRGRSNVKTLCALVILPSFLLFFYLLDDLGRAATKSMKLRNNVQYLSGSKEGRMGVKNLVFERNTMNVWPQIKREVLVRSPDITLTIRGEEVEATMKCPRGILVMFHGCGRYAASFYYSPQGRRMIATANEAGMVVVAVTKSDEMGCWDSQSDFETVKEIMKKYLKSRVNSCAEGRFPPIFGFGASSGATFVEELASQMSAEGKKFAPFVFSAMNMQIMGPTPGRRWDVPTVFTVMQGDIRTKALVEHSMPVLGAGPYKLLTTSGKKTISPHHFAFVFQDDQQMTPELSEAIHRDLVGYGIIDESGALKGNPRERRGDIDIIWQKHLNDRLEAASLIDVEVTPFGTSKKLMSRLKSEEVQDANSIWLIEELNVAWDEHEITAEGFEEVITFFLDHAVLPGS